MSAMPLPWPDEATETPLGAVYAAALARLLNFSAVWADRVYMDDVPSVKAMPYALVWFIGGAALLGSLNDAQTIVTGVKTVAGTFVLANTGALHIKQALNRAGNQDRRAQGNPGIRARRGGWIITQVTLGRPIFVPETRDDGTHIFHHGYEFTWRLERS